MSPELLRWEAKASSLVAEALLDGSSLLSLRKELESIEAGEGWEASRLTQSALAEFQKARKGLPCSCEGMERAATQADAAMRRREGLKAMSEEMREGRSRYGTTVFYLVSWHQKPAEGHKAVQGTLLIDRYWKSVLERNGLGFYGDLVKEKAKGMLTVQQAVRAPTYLIVRPYCRHRIHAVPIAEALTSSDKEIRRNHPESMDHSSRTKTPSEYYRDKAKRKKAMASKINDAVLKRSEKRK